jgi:hypothetical protein
MIEVREKGNLPAFQVFTTPELTGVIKSFNQEHKRFNIYNDDVRSAYYGSYTTVPTGEVDEDGEPKTREVRRYPTLKEIRNKIVGNVVSAWFVYGHNADNFSATEFFEHFYGDYWDMDGIEEGDVEEDIEEELAEAIEEDEEYPTLLEEDQEAWKEAKRSEIEERVRERFQDDLVERVGMAAVDEVISGNWRQAAGDEEWVNDQMRAITRTPEGRALLRREIDEQQALLTLSPAQRAKVEEVVVESLNEYVDETTDEEEEEDTSSDSSDSSDSLDEAERELGRELRQALGAEEDDSRPFAVSSSSAPVPAPAPLEGEGHWFETSKRMGKAKGQYL